MRTYTKGEQKELFLAYYEVQQRGEFNMMTQAEEACYAADMTMEEYEYVQHNYRRLHSEYSESPEAKEIIKEIINDLVS